MQIGKIIDGHRQNQVSMDPDERRQKYRWQLIPLLEGRVVIGRKDFSLPDYLRYISYCLRLNKEPFIPYFQIKIFIKIITYWKEKKCKYFRCLKLVPSKLDFLLTYTKLRITDTEIYSSPGLQMSNN